MYEAPDRRAQLLTRRSRWRSSVQIRPPLPNTRTCIFASIGFFLQNAIICR